MPAFDWLNEDPNINNDDEIVDPLDSIPGTEGPDPVPTEEDQPIIREVTNQDDDDDESEDYRETSSSASRETETDSSSSENGEGGEENPALDVLGGMYRFYGIEDQFNPEHFKDVKTEQDIWEVVDEFVDATVQQRLQEAFASPEIVQLNEFVKNGGTVDRYFQLRNNNASQLERLSPEQIFYSFQKRIDSTATDAEIKDEMQELKDLGTFERKVSIAKNKLLQMERIEGQRQIELQNAVKQQEQQSVRNFQAHVYDLATKSTEINGIPLKKGDPERIYQYLFQAVDNKGNSQVMIDMDDPQFLLTAALLRLRGVNRIVEQAEKKGASKSTLDSFQRLTKSKTPAFDNARSETPARKNAFGWMDER